METQPQPQPANQPIDITAQAYCHLMHTLIALLPPPIEDTPEATLTRNHAAIARIAALAPVNASEAELAAQCIAPRAQAKDLIRLHDNDINLVIRLGAQYAAMVRASLSAHNRLLREQQQRRKRETANRAADQDEWTRHIAAQSMLAALETAPNPQKIPKTETKSQTQKNETPKRRPKPQYHTIASVNARIDAAMRAAVPGWQPPAIPGLRKAPPLPNPAGDELIEGNAQRPGQP